MQNLKTMFSILTTVIVNLCLRAQWPLGTATDAESNTSWCAAPASKWSRGWQVAVFFLFDWQRWYFNSSNQSILRIKRTFWTHFWHSKAVSSRHLRMNFEGSNLFPAWNYRWGHKVFNLQDLDPGQWTFREGTWGEGFFWVQDWWWIYDGILMDFGWVLDRFWMGFWWISKLRLLLRLLLDGNFFFF